ncbi:MAG TPA: hypothetical protein VGF46_09305 [Gaiellales bacterium]
MTPLRIALATAACALVAAPVPSVAAADGPGILGATFAQRSGTIVRLDPLTLTRLGTPLAAVGSPWSATRISPALIALGGGARVRIVDPADGRVVSRVAAGSPTLALASARGNRLLVVSRWNRSVLVLADPATGRVISRRPLGGDLVAGVASKGRLVLLVGPVSDIGPTRLVVVSARGGVHSAPLARIEAGTRGSATIGADTARSEAPGLAVDPAGQRAAIVDGNGRVAIVDLRSLRVVMHQIVSRRLSAQQKEISGWQRTVAWPTPSVLAVTGMDYRGEARPAGLRLIRTGNWTSRLVQPSANALTLADGAVLAIGNLTHGIGLRAYEPDGHLRYHRFGAEKLADITETGGRVYASACNSYCYRVVDPGTGRLLASPNLTTQTVLIP